VSIRKISNKRLSRNLKTRKVPLRVLPLAPLHKRYRLNQSIQKQEKRDLQVKQSPAMTVQCAVEKVTRTTGKNVKKTAEKRPLKIKPFLSFRGTMNALRWILLLIFVYLAIGTAVVMIQDGTEPLKNIIIYSIMGFFTFFMGYIGWILAHDVLDIVAGKKNSHNEAEMET
jgi:hypothetical protein